MYISIWTIPENDFVCNSLYDNYVLHQEANNIFDEQVQFNVTYKQNIAEVLIYSKKQIIITPKFGKIKIKEFNPTFSPGTYRIDVCANIVRNVFVNGKTKDIPLIKEEDISDWFNKRADSFGVVVNTVVIKGNESYRFRQKKNNNQITAVVNNVSVICQLKNEENFKNMVFNGIGAQKKFGFGLVKVFKIS